MVTFLHIAFRGLRGFVLFKGCWSEGKGSEGENAVVGKGERGREGENVEEGKGEREGLKGRKRKERKGENVKEGMREKEGKRGERK